MAIRLNDIDRAVINDTARFNGLSLESLRQTHFNGSTYAWKRLNKLLDNGYLQREYYYSIGEHNAKREAAIYYPKRKGLDAIGSSLDARYFIPKKDKLDVQYLLSELFSKIPGLMSKRELVKEFHLKNFMPITCAVLTNPTTFISIIGEKKYHGEVVKTINFAKNKLINGRYIIISKNYPGKEFLTAEAYFIKWNLASKVLPNILYDNDFYINKFTDYLKPRERLGKCSKNVFALAKDSNGVFNIGELFTGYSRLIINLATPPRRTIVLIPDKNYLKYIKLKSGYNFIVYDKSDKSYYRAFEEGGNIKTKPYP